MAGDFQEAIELASVGMTDEDIALLIGVDVAELRRPWVARELQIARTRSVAALAKAAMESALSSKDGAEIRQLLRLLGKDLSEPEQARKSAPVMVTPGSVSDAIKKQQQMLANHQFDELDRNS
jgi:hypothetical protein